MSPLKIIAALVLALPALHATLALAHGNHDLPPLGSNAPAAAPAPEKEFGRAGKPSLVTRNISLDLAKQRLVPAEVRVKPGETVKFIIRNSEASPDTVVLGTAASLKERAALARKYPKMEMNVPNQVSVGPGQSAELVWQFTKSGEFAFASASPANAEAAIAGRIVVAAD